MQVSLGRQATHKELHVQLLWWPTQNELKDMFGGSLSCVTKMLWQGIFIFFFFCHYGSFVHTHIHTKAHTLWLLVLCFYGILVWVNKYVFVSLHLFVFLIFFLWLFCFVLFWAFVFFYLIWLFLFLRLLFSKKRQNGCGSSLRGGGTGTGKSWGKENCNLNILQEKKINFL